MAEQPLLLALDQGTSSSRAALFSSSGDLVLSASAPLPISYPADGWVEQDPIEIWTSQRQALVQLYSCLLYTSPSPRDTALSRMPSSA